MTTPTENTHLRTLQHRGSFYLTVIVPETLLAFEVSGSPARGTMVLEGSSGVGSLDNIRDGNTLEVTTANGIKEVRIKGVSGSEASPVLALAANSIVFTDGDICNVKAEFPLRRKLARFTASNFYRDWNVAYIPGTGGQNYKTTPVCIARSHKIGFVDDELVVPINLTDSYPTFPNATIPIFSAEAISDDPPTIDIDPDTGIGTITTEDPGQWWVDYGCEDSNGASQHTYRRFVAASRNPASPYYPYMDWEVEGFSADKTRGGYNLRMKVYGTANKTRFPDRAIIILWYEAWYGTNEEFIGGATDAENILFMGYIRQGSVVSNWDYGTVSFDAYTVDEEMRNLYTRSAILRAAALPTTWNDFRNPLTNTMAVWHMYKYCSNLLSMTDVYGLTSSSLLRDAVTFPQGNLYSVTNDILYRYSISARVICNKAGQLYIGRYPQLMTLAERDALDTEFTFDRQDWVDEITIEEQIRPHTAQVAVQGLHWNGSVASAHCSKAPGEALEESGLDVVVVDRQTSASQADMNSLSGRHLAIQNNRYSPIRFKAAGMYNGFLDIANAVWYGIDIASDDNNRGIIHEGRALLTELNFAIDNLNGFMSTEVTLEPEAIGEDGVTDNCITGIPPEGDAAGTPNTEARWEVDEVLGAMGVFTQGSSGFYYRDNNASEWAQRNGDLVDTDIEDEGGTYDPWSKTIKRNRSNNPEQAVLWKVVAGNVLCSTDAGKAWQSVLPFSDPPNLWADTPAPTPFDPTYRQVLQSPYDSEHLFVSGEWLNGIGSQRGWVYRYSYTTGDLYWIDLYDGITLPDLLLPIWMDVNSVNLYVSVWADDLLKILVFDTTTLAYVTEYSFGAASLAEYLAGTRLVRPVTVIDDPDVFYAFGNMVEVP